MIWMLLIPLKTAHKDADSQQHSISRLNQNPHFPCWANNNEREGKGKNEKNERTFNLLYSNTDAILYKNEVQYLGVLISCEIWRRLNRIEIENDDIARKPFKSSQVVSARGTTKSSYRLGYLLFEGSCNAPWTIPQPPNPKCSPSLAIRQSGSIIPTHETHDRLAPSRDILNLFFLLSFPPLHCWADWDN